jgi:hypothetical protein
MRPVLAKYFASFSLRSPLLTILTLVLAAPAFAQQGNSPWENAVNVLMTAFTSTIARGLSLVAIVVSGLTFAFEQSKQTSPIRSTSSSRSSVGLDADTSPKFSLSTDTIPTQTYSTTAPSSKPIESSHEQGHRIQREIALGFGICPRAVRAR